MIALSPHNGWHRGDGPDKSYSWVMEVNGPLYGAAYSLQPTVQGRANWDPHWPLTGKLPRARADLSDGCDWELTNWGHTSCPALPGCHCWLNTRYGWLSNFKIQLDAVTSLAWGEYTFKWLLIRKLCDNCPDWFRDWWYLWPWPWPWSMVTPTSAWFPRFR